MKYLSERKKEQERKNPVENPDFQQRCVENPVEKSRFSTKLSTDPCGKPKPRTKGHGAKVYSERVFCCPYYDGGGTRSVNCEGGKIRLPSGGAARDYFSEYCGDLNGWRRCTLARTITRFYEAEED